MTEVWRSDRHYPASLHCRSHEAIAKGLTTLAGRVMKAPYAVAMHAIQVCRHWRGC